MSCQMMLCNRVVRGHMNPSLGPFAGEKCVLRYQKRAPHRRYSSIITAVSSDPKSKFMQVYEILKSEILCDPIFKFDNHSRQWVSQMIDYNVPRGKLVRGLFVMESYELLKGEELTDEEVFLACTLGWCLQWVQTFGLMHDDIMDGAYKRRGQPCWFRLPEVGLEAVNDAVILRNHVPRILKKHFKGKDYYVDLIEHFNEGEFQVVTGQMMDMIAKRVGEKDLSNYTMSLNRRIHEYKTAWTSFYLPVVCALLMLGENLDDYGLVEDVLIEIGIYYQVQDDYLDMFGDPDVVGKIGYDIQDFKCSWLVVKALELANEEQKSILFESYGKNDPTCVAKVKELYHTLNLQGVFEDYEKKTHEKIMKSIQAHPNKAMHKVVRSLLGKLYKRQK